jgi:hypothetical protein
MPGLLAAADLLAEGASVVVTGAGEAAAALCRTVLAAADPAVVLLRAPDPAAIPPGHPAHGKTAPGAAYVCRGGTCALPVFDSAALAAALRRGGAIPPAGPST